MKTAAIVLALIVTLSGCGADDPHSETITKGGSTNIKVSCV